jgi:hypothetical protein
VIYLSEIAAAGKDGAEDRQTLLCLEVELPVDCQFRNILTIRRSYQIEQIGVIFVDMV